MICCSFKANYCDLRNKKLGTIWSNLQPMAFVVKLSCSFHLIDDEINRNMLCEERGYLNMIEGSYFKQKCKCCLSNQERGYTGTKHDLYKIVRAST